MGKSQADERLIMIRYVHRSFLGAPLPTMKFFPFAFPSSIVFPIRTSSRLKNPRPSRPLVLTSGLQ